MNKRQKIVQERFLDNEEEIIKRLKSTYEKSLEDINKAVEELQDEINQLDSIMLFADDAEKEILLSRKRSKIYQKQYQDALKLQIGSILDTMQVEEFKDVDSYLKKCYEDGFVGAIFDLHGQGIPIITPINQKALVRAVQTDSKISQGLYKKLGEDVAELKKRITSEVSRGIATGRSYDDIARSLSVHTKIGYNRAVRIARTEGHRIQVQSTLDVCYEAREKGADIVKQWDSTMDRKTRKSHAKVDGEIRDLDEPFSNDLMFPGDPDGGASEVVNCRCALLQRAKWGLDESELETLKERAKYFGLDKADDFDDFKKKYLKVVEEIEEFDITEGGKFLELTTKDKNEYADAIEHEYITQRMTRKEVDILWQKDGGYIRNTKGYNDINRFMRGIQNKLKNAKCRLTIKVMERLTKNNKLVKNYIGTRKVDMDYLFDVVGLDVTGLTKISYRKDGMGRTRPVKVPKDRLAAQSICDQINELVGTDKSIIPDKAFTSISLDENLNYFTHYPVKYKLQMEKGTNGIITSNLVESEFIAKNDSSIEILRAEVYNDGKDDCILIYGILRQ